MGQATPTGACARGVQPVAADVVDALGGYVLREFGDEVCDGEQLQVLAEVRIVGCVEENLAALLLEGDICE